MPVYLILWYQCSCFKTSSLHFNVAIFNKTRVEFVLIKLEVTILLPDDAIPVLCGESPDLT